MNGWKKTFPANYSGVQENRITTIMVTMGPTRIYTNIVWQARVRD